MSIKNKYTLVLIFLLLAASFSYTQTISGVFGSAGGKQTNSTHQLSSTMGECLIGFSNNSSTKSYAGFWYTYIESITTDVENQLTVPTEYKLAQNYPNPFNPVTTIQYSIPQRSNVLLKVYDVLGNEVATLVNEEKDRGVYSVNFDATQLTSGIYFYTLQASDFIETKKMILIK